MRKLITFLLLCVPLGASANTYSFGIRFETSFLSTNVAMLPETYGLYVPSGIVGADGLPILASIASMNSLSNELRQARIDSTNDLKTAYVSADTVVSNGAVAVTV